MLQEEPSRGFEHHVSLECRDALVLSRNCIKVRSVEWRSIARISRIIGPQRFQCRLIGARNKGCADIFLELCFRPVIVNGANVSGTSASISLVITDVTFVLDRENKVPSSSTSPDTREIFITLPCSTSLWGLSCKNLPSARGDQARANAYKQIVVPKRRGRKCEQDLPYS